MEKDPSISRVLSVVPLRIAAVDEKTVPSLVIKQARPWNPRGMETQVGKNILIVFTRYPRPGATKTRLVPVLGAAGAAELQRRMTDRTLSTVKEFRRDHSVTAEVHYEGASQEQMKQWLGAELQFSPQASGDLGRRMEQAFHESLRGGTCSVVLIGTDCPALTSRHLQEAFDHLEYADVVLGPARDGGYYLVGLHRHTPELFRGIPWGTNTVLEQTLEIGEKLGLRVALLDPLDDVDRPEDLAVWEQVTGKEVQASWLPRISVIIPARDEAEMIGKTLASTRDAKRVIERIVVDGGSQDGTAARALACGAQVVRSAPGRAVQMNAGAQAAKGDTLLFLHADTCLPRDFEHHVQRVLSRPSTVAGAFQLRFDEQRPILWTIEQVANLRSVWMGMPYGDQAVFLKADRFHQAGGFPEIPLMEDFEFMRRLRPHGRIDIAPVPVVTSARRYERKGPLRTVMLNQLIILAFLIGVSPDRLARWYRGNTSTQEQKHV
jgi:rSAM/selenodomain-associated transferase 2/rSAM/selenodomain-associated transferase 1